MDSILLLLFFAWIWTKVARQPKRDLSELSLVAFAMTAAHELMAGKPVMRLAEVDWRTMLGM